MNVLRPHTFEDALALKAAHPEAVPMAGGTDLLVYWPSNLEAHARTYLDLSGLGELRSVTFEGDDLVLGAAATFWDVIDSPACLERYPALIEAARQVGAIQIQSRGTWAGNVANGSPAADGVAALMAHGAEVVLASAQGERRIALERFYTGYRTTVLKPEELIRAIRVPGAACELSRFVKVGPRRAQAITKVGAAVTVSGGAWRIVAVSMAPTVRRCERLEALVASETPIRAPGDLLSAIDEDLTPIDDLRSTAAYRRKAFARIIFALLEERGALAPGMPTS